MNSEKAKETLDWLIDKLIYQEELPGTLTKLILTPPAGPMQKWSLMNQLMVLVHGYSCARGFRQWQQVKRCVKKGMKAIYILGPVMIPVPVKDKEGKETGEKQPKLVGFKAIPVFGYEQTEGEELPEYMTKDAISRSLPHLPLSNIASDLDLEVKAEFTKNGEAGYFQPEAKIIGICTDSQQTFLHELSHAVDYKLNNNSSSREEGEVVAELSACFLSYTLGLSANMKYTQNYIRSWSGQQHPGIAIARAIDRVKAIYDFCSLQTNEQAA